MAIEPVKIPQNVYVEDRIVGPLTLRQLIIVGLGSGFSYMMYSTAAKYGVLSIPLTIMFWTPAAISAAFAFLKINDLSLFHMILLYIEHLQKPSTRRWTPHPGISINIVTRTPKDETAALAARQESDTRKLSELSRQLEERDRQLGELSKTVAEQEEGQAIASMQAATPPAAAPQAPAEAVPLPVNPERIKVSGTEPGSSIDGVGTDLNAFSHLFQ